MPDVIVVGAGPVGGFVALLLARRGLTVTVIERRTGISERSRAIGIHPPAARALRQANVSLEGSVEIPRATARDRGDVLAELRFADPVLSLPQHVLERSLRGLLAECATATVHQGAAARLANPTAGRRAADRTTTTAAVTVDGRRIDARVVIAADGVGSELRTAADIRWLPVAGRARYVMADIADATGLGSEAALWFASSGVVESFPLPHGRRRWVARSRSATTEEGLSDAVARRTGIHVTVPPGALSTFVARQHIARPWVHGRLVLLGDAAHEISPIGGQGMNLGLLDATQLADALPRHLDGDAAALAGWEAVRRRSARRAMAQARFNMAVGSPAWRAAQPLRRGGIRLLSLQHARLADTFTMQNL